MTLAQTACACLHGAKGQENMPDMQKQPINQIPFSLLARQHYSLAMSWPLLPMQQEAWPCVVVCVGLFTCGGIWMRRWKWGNFRVQAFDTERGLMDKTGCKCVFVQQWWGEGLESGNFSLHTFVNIKAPYCNLASIIFIHEFLKPKMKLKSGNY